MKHANTHEDEYAAVCEAIVQVAMAKARESGLCPSCMLAYIATFVVANMLLRTREDGMPDEMLELKVEAIFDSLCEGALLLAGRLEKHGENWESASTADKPLMH